MNRTQAGFTLLGRRVQGEALIGFRWIRVVAGLVGVLLAFALQPVVSGVVYGIFFVPALLGSREWRRQYSRRLKVVTA
jgi:hypothetical protein